MSPSRENCDPRQLESLLLESVSPDEQARLEAHLIDCDACRQRIESSAAEPATWIEVTEMLGDPRWRTDDGSTKVGTQDGVLSAIVRSVLSTLAPTDDPNMLGRIDGYEVSGVIGSGGMGVVLKGVDPSLQRVVAIKVLAPHFASSGAARQRFAREAQAAAAITHDNVIDIYAVAEANGLPYLVMPYSRGTTLQGRIDTKGPLPLVETLRIGLQLAAGLSAAHEQGLVHRDIKPANILLSDGVDRLQITDFGLARAVDDASVTKTGVIAGTPHFMSPEQARGESVDHRSDLFSLGSVLYTCLAGRPPFRAESTFGILRRITDNEPRPIREINPNVPEWLCTIVEKLHAKSPSARYQSVTEVADLLRQCLAHVQTRGESLPAELLSPKRSRFRIGLVVLSALAVLVVASFVLTEKFRAAKSVVPPQRESSELPVDRVSTDWIDANFDSPADLQRMARELEKETRLP